MNAKIISQGILRAVGTIAAIVLVLFILYQISSIIVYLVIAVVLSLLGRPIIIFMKRKLKFNNTVAVVITICMFLGFFLGLVSLFIPLIVEQGSNLSLLDIDQLREKVETIYSYASDHFHMGSTTLEEELEKSELLNKIDYTFLPDLFNALVSGLGSFGIGLFSVLFIAFFFLRDSKMFDRIILIILPNNWEDHYRNSSKKIKDLLSRYFIGLFAQISVLFVIYTIGLLIIGVNNAVVIAFLCALLNLIPYVGPLIGGGLMILLTMTNYLDSSFSEVILPKAMYVLIVLSIGQVIDNFFSQPIILGKSVKSHPLEIFLVILIAGVLFGVIGLIVAVPAYSSIKVILKEFLADNKIVKELTKDI
ncbi:AI-2E family transporter [Mangrovimonas sp. ST2L15]|uniref:AI-2E family transporter n=1 Tax=Mangrovimonas sp. ST2L15 TaxID=1645916 RepID=UPI0006B536A1|nr:AI-2E family transporter [Mangrovimonas sp. ST2L15]